MGLLTRVPITPSALLELINLPNPYCGVGLHAVPRAVGTDLRRKTPHQLGVSEQFCAGPACMNLLEKIKYHAERLWPAEGGQPVPASAKKRNGLIREAFKDANDIAPSDVSIKRALKDTRFMKSRPNCRKL